MSKSCNRWNLSMLVAVLLTGCGIFHFADPVTMEGSLSDLSGVQDLRPVSNDAGTEPKGFCAKEYAHQSSSYKVRACWDGSSLPSLSNCSDRTWKHFPCKAMEKCSTEQSKWGFSTTFMGNISCSIYTSDLVNFSSEGSIIIKIWHEQIMPAGDPNYIYKISYVPGVGDAVVTKEWSRVDSGNYIFKEEEITVNSTTAWRGISVDATADSSTAMNPPGWLFHGLAIIQKN